MAYNLGSVQGKRNSPCVNMSKSASNPLLGQPQTLLTNLPTGWKREECVKRPGLDTGKSDIYYIGPQGQKVKTKQELFNALGGRFDLSLFDFRTGKVSILQAPRKLDEQPTAAKVPRVDTSIGAFNRRTPPLGSLTPVVIRSHPDCRRTEVRNSNVDAPRQLFWEKRLANNVAIDPDTGEAYKPLRLPHGIQTAGVPGYEPTQLVQSLVHALATKQSPITGQEQQPSSIERNPCVSVNHLQPMIKTYIVTDEDVRRQESRVRELRKKLEMARKKLHPPCLVERAG